MTTKELIEKALITSSTSGGNLQNLLVELATRLLELDPSAKDSSNEWLL